MTKVEIVNAALVRIGTRPVVSLDDPISQVVPSVRALWDDNFEAIARIRPWACLSKFGDLTEISLPEDELIGYHHAWQLPGDFIRLRRLNTEDMWEKKGEFYEILGDRLVTRASKAKILYVARITNTVLYDTLFTRCLIIGLAMSLSVPVRQDTALRESFASELERVLPPAGSVDGGERKVRRYNPFEDSAILAARRFSTNA